MTPTLTESREKPEVRNLPPLDAAKAAAASPGRYLTQRLAVEDTAERAARAGALADAWEKKLAAVRADRDRAAYTLTVAYTVRRGAKIPEALGVQRTRWKVIRDRQTALAPEPMEDAADRLPGLALEHDVVRRQLRHIIDVRDAAVFALHEGGMSQAAIGRLIGRDAARVNRILNKTD